MLQHNSLICLNASTALDRLRPCGYVNLPRTPAQGGATMAMATIRFNAATLASQTPWWGRRDPYVLVPLVAVHAAVVGPAAGHLNEWPLGAVLVGVLFAQCLLL